MRTHRLCLAPATVMTLALLAPSAGRADAPAGRYTAKSGTVYDAKTKLTWQVVVASTQSVWSDASKACATLSLNGTGWRLPSIKELHTIVDETRFDPAIDPTAFPSTPVGSYWSSSNVAQFPSFAWAVDFGAGYDVFVDVSSKRFVRCVR